MIGDAYQYLYRLTVYTIVSLVLFKNVINKMCLQIIYI